MFEPAHFPAIDSIPPQFWKMSREEYCILADVVLETKATKILEFGAGMEWAQKYSY